MANTAGGASAITLPNIVSSVTAGNSNIVIGGTSAIPTVALNDPISLASGISTTGSGTLSVAGTSTLTGKVTLGNPLTLSNVSPTLATQLGYTYAPVYSGPAPGTALTNNGSTTYTTQVVSQPGVYIVNAFLKIGINAATTVQTFGACLDTTNAGGAYARHIVAYPSSVFSASSSTVLPINTVVTVTSSTTFTFFVNCAFSAGTLTTQSDNYGVFITRIA